MGVVLRDMPHRTLPLVGQVFPYAYFTVALRG